jgi:hypothetical protein
MKFTTIIFSTLILISACKKKTTDRKSTQRAQFPALPIVCRKEFKLIIPFAVYAADISETANNGSLNGGSFIADRLGNDKQCRAVNFG